MSAAVDTTFDVDVDLTKEVPCEHPNHPREHWIHAGPGALYVKNLPCPRCGDVPRAGFIICRKAFLKALIVGVHCTLCRYSGHRDDFWLLVREL